jgi:hypothetical protein
MNEISVFIKEARGSLFAPFTREDGGRRCHLWLKYKTFFTDLQIFSFVSLRELFCTKYLKDSKHSMNVDCWYHHSVYLTTSLLAMLKDMFCVATFSECLWSLLNKVLSVEMVVCLCYCWWEQSREMVWFTPVLWKTSQKLI